MRRRLVTGGVLRAPALAVGAFLAGLLCGVAVTATAQQERGFDERVFGQAEAYFLALHNMVVSLSVDTERSAIGIARIEKRLGKLERRMKSLESSKPKTP